MKVFCQKLREILKDWSKGTSSPINILWVGIGLGEEALLLSQYFKLHEIRVRIHGIDIATYDSSMLCYFPLHK